MLRSFSLFYSFVLFWVVVAGWVAAVAAPLPRPAWLEQGSVRRPKLKVLSPNASYLEETSVDHELMTNQSMLPEMSEIMDSQRALEWNQVYLKMSREHEMAEAAGMSNIHSERAYEESVRNLGNNVSDEVSKWHLNNTAQRATDVARGHESVAMLVSPALLAAGVYTGRPLRKRFDENTSVSVRTSLRDRYGAFEFDSVFGRSQFEYRPRASDLVARPGAAMDIGAQMDFNRIADLSQDRYQFSFSRRIPMFDLTSQVLYGASSKTVGGAVTKRFSDHISCVVDSVHWLTPYGSAPADEQKIRLRYDLRF